MIKLTKSSCIKKTGYVNPLNAKNHLHNIKELFFKIPVEEKMKIENGGFLHKS